MQNTPVIEDFHPFTPNTDTAKSTNASAAGAQNALPQMSSFAASTAAQASFAELESNLDYLSPQDIESVRAAYRYADSAHLGQMRRNGDPYITHPIAVASICTHWRLDSQALIAALLHDVMEDCGISKSELIAHFGAPVAELVDGLTKLDHLQFTTREEGQAENFRKMLIAMSQDVRVILIKLADRTHNMRTLGDVPRTKWSRIAGETMDIYVPIAHRLGLHRLYRELQDLSFQYLFPWRHRTLNKAIQNARKRRKDLITTVQEQVALAFAKAKIGLDMSGREKTLYSIYKKMRDKRLTFSRVSDIYGFRIIVPDVTDCYTALGILHQMYPPVPGRFKDYIAIPKVNAYQSLHTTLVGPAGLHIEFQFRTDAMNLIAESGVAAHWQYKATGSEQAAGVGTAWLQSLLDIQNETRDATEFWDHVKIDLFPDEVYVFTPKGKIMAMPRGATVVDFAYAIHTNLGDRCVAAAINGKQVPLRSVLRNGDEIHIETSPSAEPNPAWLGFVTTGRARSKIRHFIKNQEHGASNTLGAKLLLQALRAEGFNQLPTTASDKALWEKILRFAGSKSIDELMTDIGLGKRAASIIAKRMVKQLLADGHKPDALLLSRARFASDDTLPLLAIQIDGSEPGKTVQFPQCCMPVPGDAIVGYMGHGEGLTLHHQACTVAARMQSKDKERFIDVEWNDATVRNFETKIRVIIESGKGGLAKLAAVIAKNEADIAQVHMGVERQFGDSSDLDFIVSVRDVAHLAILLRALKQMSIVLSAERVIN